MTAIDTAQVKGRRELHFASVDDILADVERLASAQEIRALGNWSPGQVFKHLAILMNGSIDGIDHQLPGVVQLLLRLFLKNRLLNKPMPPGFQLPRTASAIIPPETTVEAGLANIRQAIGRLKVETASGRHPALGQLTREEWHKLHCRHSELHLSFLIPVT